MGWIFALFLRPHRRDLYKFAGPTMGHLQHLKKKNRQMPDKCPEGVGEGGEGDAHGWN